MALLNAEPSGSVRSMEEFFAIAQAIEVDAARRYTETGRELRAAGLDRLAAVFEHLAGLEGQHVEQVRSWASRSQVPAIPEEPPWQIPDTFDTLPSGVPSRLMTAYRALASAVRHEQRAFAFWTYVSAHADRDDVRRAAEKMALEELEHASLLRRERRQAYRAEGAGGDVATPLASLAATERRVADLLERAASGASWSSHAQALAARSRASAAKLDAVTAGPLVPAPRISPEHEDDIAALAEYLAEAYLRLAETSRDEQLLATAQELAAAAIERLGTLDPAYPLAGAT